MGPLTRTGMNETVQVSLYALVNAFCLAVRLRVICCAHAQMGAYQLKQLLPEIACEDPITVRHNIIRHAMQFVNIVKKYLCYFGRSERMS